jgi:TRAP-type C4-dicarboxylate transport system permease small subunit
MVPEHIVARVEQAIGLLARTLAALAAGAGAAILVLVVAAVVMRYVVSAPLRFTEELSGLLLAQMVFLAIPAVLLANQNIRVTLLVDRLPPLGRRIAFVIGQIILVAFCVWFVREAWAIASFEARLGAMSEQSRLPLAPWRYAIVAMVIFTAAIAAWQALTRARRA